MKNIIGFPLRHNWEKQSHPSRAIDATGDDLTGIQNVPFRFFFYWFQCFHIHLSSMVWSLSQLTLCESWATSTLGMLPVHHRDEIQRIHTYGDYTDLLCFMLLTAGGSWSIWKEPRKKTKNTHLENVRKWNVENGNPAWKDFRQPFSPPHHCAALIMHPAF